MHEDALKKNHFNFKNTVVMGALHIGAIAALFCYSPRRLALALLVMFIAGAPGIGVGFHRFLTHSGFKLPKWVGYTLVGFGCLALQGGPVWWVTWHRMHHADTEVPGKDPHTPREGGFWAHMGWIVFMNQRTHDYALQKKWALDLLRDPVYCFMGRWHALAPAILALSLLCFYGLPTMLWGSVLPILVGLHCTWLVNSATHMWGSRRFPTDDDSRNSWWVALLTWGEGWHNNHHAHPKSARHGLAWYEFDLNWIIIWILRFLRIAKKVNVASLQ